jgi:hypothetical protein
MTLAWADKSAEIDFSHLSSIFSAVTLAFASSALSPALARSFTHSRRGALAEIAFLSAAVTSPPYPDDEPFQSHSISASITRRVSLDANAIVVKERLLL